MPLGLPGDSELRKHAYTEMISRHVPAGLVDSGDLLEGIAFLYVPSFVLMDESLASKLRAFVESGGILVATARTATRDRRNHVIAQTPPGLVADLFGITVEEFGKLETPDVALVYENQTVPAGSAYEILRPGAAKTLAVWRNQTAGIHAADGSPAITVNEVGKGRAIYVGTFLTETNAGGLFDLLLPFADLPPLGSADAAVEITCRHSPDHKLTFVLNHYPVSKTAKSLPDGIELLSGKPCRGEVELAGYGVAIIEHS